MLIRRAVDAYLSQEKRDAATWQAQWRKTVDGTTGVAPCVRLPEDQATLLPLPRGLGSRATHQAPRPERTIRAALPVESLQHPLSVYQALLEVAA